MAKNVILTETGFKNIYRGYLKYIALQSGGVDAKNPLYISQVIIR